MSAYIARIKEDKQMVGFFWASTINELFWMVDECCDPYIVEFIKTNRGGVFWQEPIDWKFIDPFPIQSEECYEAYENLRLKAGAPTISEYIMVDIKNDDRWRTFTREDARSLQHG
jgi:hypothetical protein